jgi:hypothetical protein
MTVQELSELLARLPPEAELIHDDGVMLLSLTGFRAYTAMGVIGDHTLRLAVFSLKTEDQYVLLLGD